MQISKHAAKEIARLMILPGIVLSVVMLLHFTPLKQYALDLQRWKGMISDFGWKAHLAFFVTVTAAIALGAPRLMLALIGGTLFGFIEGLAIGVTSALIGSYVVFITALRSTSEVVYEKLKKRDVIRKLLEKPSILNIFFVRQLPVPALALNLFLGVVKTPHRKFLIGTILGQLPGTIAVVAMGSAMGKDNAQLALKQVSIGMIALAIVTFIVIVVRRKFEKKNSAVPEVVAEQELSSS